MKKLVALTAILFLITTLSGCLSTLHPIFTAKDLVFDPRLIGTWHDGNKDEEVFIYERGTGNTFKALPEALQQIADKAYLLTIRNKEDNLDYKYYAFLARIGNHLYFDYYPAEIKWQQRYNDFFKQHQVSMHTFYRVRFNSDGSFETSQFAQKFMDNLIEKKKIRIKHETRFDGTYVITAPTEELQQYILKYADVPEAYENGNTTTFYKLP